jgi:Protein of unknown function (DUF3558)
MIRMKLLGGSGALAVSALVIAGCGGSTNTTTPTATAPGASSSSASTQSSAAANQGGSAVDPCTLITEQDATTAIGTDPGPGTARASAAGPSCTYLVSTDGRGVIVGVTLNSNRAQYDAARAQFQQKYTVQDASGIGNAAFVVSASGGAAPVLVFIKGSDVVSIALSGLASAASTDTLTTLGHAASGRL